MVMKVKSAHTHIHAYTQRESTYMSVHRSVLSTSQFYHSFTNNELEKSDELLFKICFLFDFMYVDVCIWVCAWVQCLQMTEVSDLCK